MGANATLREVKDTGSAREDTSKLWPWPQLGPSELSQLDHIMFRRKLVCGEQAYAMGARFHSLYGIRKGTFKSVAVSQGGREQVVAFHVPGDFIGIDGIDSDVHGCTAVALEDAEVCGIPFARLTELGRESPALQRTVHRILSSHIVRQYELIALLGCLSAEERLASFLLDYARRVARGQPLSRFDLPMSREDIASHLGVSPETVSRAFTRLQEQGLVAVRQRRVRLLDMQAMRARLARAGGRVPASADGPRSAMPNARVVRPVLNDPFRVLLQQACDRGKV